MAIIYNIDDYRKKREQEMLKEAKTEFRRIIESMGTWQSKEEKIRFYIKPAYLSRHEIKIS